VPDDELSLGEAAEILGVHPDTLRAWADDKRVAMWRTPGGQRRFRRRDLEALKPWITEDEPAGQ
jgi:excisionase family DNA binding protein